MKKQVKLGAEVGGFLKSLQLFMFVPANQARLEDKAFIFGLFRKYNLFFILIISNFLTYIIFLKNCDY